MQLAATIAHVESINLRGESLDEEARGIDASELTILLRKKLEGDRLVDYALTNEENNRLIMEKYRRLSHRPDSYGEHSIFPDPHNCRNGYTDPYNCRKGYPDPYSYNNGFPNPYDYRSDDLDWRRYYDQPRIDLEPYPLEQLEYVSYYDD